jgi:hypothetical protein
MNPDYGGRLKMLDLESINTFSIMYFVGTSCNNSVTNSFYFCAHKEWFHYTTPLNTAKTATSL